MKKRYGILLNLFALIAFASVALADGISTTPGQRLHQGGAVLPVQGGTGIRSYAVGDTLYASGTNTLVRLPDVATGSFFVSGGVNTAPAWTAASSLSPAFVGTNITGTAASFTAGNVTTNANLTGPITSVGNAVASLTAHNVLTGNGSGAITSVAPSTSGNVLTSNGTDWTSAAASGSLTLGTTTAFNSATSYAVTGLPAGIKTFTVNLASVTMSGNSQLLFQIGDATGGLKTTGYTSNWVDISASTSTGTGTTGITCQTSAATPTLVSGAIIFNLVDATNFIWNASANFKTSTYQILCGGDITLAAALDRMTFTTVAGTATWTAGKINISYSK